MFDFRNFVKKGLLDAVGRQPDYWVILNAASYHEKAVLMTEDLAEIQAAIEAQYQIENQEEEVLTEEQEELGDG